MPAVVGGEAPLVIFVLRLFRYRVLRFGSASVLLCWLLAVEVLCLYFQLNQGPPPFNFLPKQAVVTITQLPNSRQ